LEKDTIDSFEALVDIAVEAMSWAMENGAKIYWIKAMRTALSVLFNYRFNKELSDNPLVKSIVRACELTQLTVKEPLQLTWKLPDLLAYIRDMPPNASLSYGQLQRKCLALVMTNTAARFTEIAQFVVTAKEPKGKEKEWRFYIQIKGKACLQPVVLHQTVDSRLNPIIAMRALKQRMISRKWIRKNKPTGSFWRNEIGQTMKPEHLRAQVKRLLADAGIQESSPYHLKHATMTCLYKKGASADHLRRLARHTHSSNAYTDFYLDEDMGASCSRMIESVMSSGSKRKQVAKKATKGKTKLSIPHAQKRFLRSERKRR
jgi:hypothetical protein